ncbi:MAG: acyl-CoA dehydratase activase [Nitrospinota bacterium]
MKYKELLLGVDIGSVSVKAVLLDGSNALVAEYYRRHKGEPLKVFKSLVKDIEKTYPNLSIRRLIFTGTGGRHIAELIGAKFVNEVMAHAEAVSRLYPDVRTVIEMGGEDSKLLIFGKSIKRGTSILDDFSMNTMCAAGTGSFLDQQAARLGINIENDFGNIALTSENPPRIAGRCSVFAKSDMIHLQQIGSPIKDIVAGLCYALARSFKTSLGMGKPFNKPIMFEGGVAANKGLVRAFEDILDLARGELIIPEHFTTMGAIGSLFITEGEDNQTDLATIIAKLETPPPNSCQVSDTTPLVRSKNASKPNVTIKGVELGDKKKVFLGVDIGSLSTNLVLIDEDKNIVSRRYLRTAGRPLDIVTGGLLEIEQETGDRVEVAGVGVTGSGRYMVGKYVGADVIKNEITAQAAAAIHFVPDVDTIFEIGGQDSKYISLNNGAVVDFEMNKVCAAGTGSFIEEQAEKLDINIEEEFSIYAFKSKSPGRFGDRCTVFIESDLVSHQQKGAPREDLVAGLAHSIVYNYLNRVVGDRKVGNRILFQGGVAWNEAVVEAFRKITAKDVTVPPHHDVTGAIGVALIAMNQEKVRKTATTFKGFDLRNREYKVTTFECKHCANVCNISRITFADEPPNFYGARCERYEKGKNKAGASLPDLFAEREKLLFGSYLDTAKSGVTKIKTHSRPVVGIPKVLHIHDYFPYWRGFFHEVGLDIVLSDTTNQKIINKTGEKVTAETCLPIKIIYGHCLDLVDKGVKNIFFPSLISMEGDWGNEVRQNYSCPLVQTAPHMMIASLYSELNDEGVRLFAPNIELKLGKKVVEKELIKFGREFGLSPATVRRGMKAGEEMLRDYRNKALSRGKYILDEIVAKKMKGVLIVSRSYNGCDPGLNMDLPKKLKDMGVVAIPLDFIDINSLPSSDAHPNMYWKTGQTYLRAARYLKGFEELPAIHLSSFKCGPDSFITHFFRNETKERPILELELDEHSADAGFVTRCEAFFDSIEYKKTSIENII